MAGGGLVLGGEGLMRDKLLDPECADYAEIVLIVVAAVVVGGLIWVI